MGTVYILKSLVNGRYYIGSTKNLTRRLEEHNRGHVKSTRLTKPFQIVFNQQYDSLIEARKVEYKLKQLKSKKIIDKIILDQVIKVGP